MSEGIKFVITAPGDATVGDGTHYATVDIPHANVSDPEYVSFIRDELRSVFADIFDAYPESVRVQTQAEWDAEQETDA